MKLTNCQHENRLCGFCGSIIHRCKCPHRRSDVLAICDECKQGERNRAADTRLRLEADSRV